MKMAVVWRESVYKNKFKCNICGHQVDDATTFAETHGGGGGTSDLKWGRNEDEDNRAWARRCMMMSKQMMKPSSGKYQKR